MVDYHIMLIESKGFRWICSRMLGKQVSVLPLLRLQAFTLRSGPLVNQVDVSIAQSGIAMHQEVLRQGHALVFHVGGNAGENLNAIIGVVFAPAGHVEMAATVADVLFHHPGDRSDVAIPRPGRLLGVAVLAGALQNAEHRRVDLPAGEELLVGMGGRRLDFPKWMDGKRSNGHQKYQDQHNGFEFFPQLLFLNFGMIHRTS